MSASNKGVAANEHVTDADTLNDNHGNAPDGADVGDCLWEGRHSCHAGDVKEVRYVKIAGRCKEQDAERLDATKRQPC